MRLLYWGSACKSTFLWLNYGLTLTDGTIFAFLDTYVATIAQIVHELGENASNLYLILDTYAKFLKLVISLDLRSAESNCVNQVDQLAELSPHPGH